MSSSTRPACPPRAARHAQRAAEPRALQFLQEMPQAIDLFDGMIAFGACRIALNQCAAHQRTQCVNVIGEGFSGIAHAQD
jgi:hypothetical protein